MADDTKNKLDAFTSKVVSDPSKPQDSLLLTGFLGTSSEANYTRIYSDATLENYVDIANSSILHSESISKDASPLGGFYVWVKKDAEVIAGKMGTDRRKAKFLEGPIVAQATGIAGGPVAAVPNTVPVVVCMPTLVVQHCQSNLQPFCPPHTVPFWRCPPPHSVPIWRCPPPHFTPFCPIGSVACGITQDPGICVASGGGPGCPVDTPTIPQLTPQFGPQFGFAAQAQPAAGFPVAQPQPATVFTCFSPNPVICNHWQSVLTPCVSVPVWHCWTHQAICRPSVLTICPTRFEPHCFPIPSPFCPVSPECPFGGIDPGGDPRFAAQAQAAGAGMAAGQAAAAPLPISVVAPCPPPLTAPSVCCFTPAAPVCPTQFGCPSHFGYHCPTIHQYHCISVQHWHCPPPHTPLCTEFGPGCQFTPNPIHCPTPNFLCPPQTLSAICVASPNCPGPGPGGPVEVGPQFGAMGAQQAAFAIPRTVPWFNCNPFTFSPWHHCPIHTPNCPR